MQNIIVKKVYEFDIKLKNSNIISRNTVHCHVRHEQSSDGRQGKNLAMMKKISELP